MRVGRGFHWLSELICLIFSEKVTEIGRSRYFSVGIHRSDFLGKRDAVTQRRERRSLERADAEATDNLAWLACLLRFASSLTLPACNAAFLLTFTPESAILQQRQI